MIKLELHTIKLILSYLLVLCGFATISLMEEVSLTFLIVSILICLITFAINIKYKPLFKDIVWTISAIIVFIFFITDYFTLTGSFLGATARFLSILLLLKLLDLKETKDHFLILYIVFFQLVIASASTVSYLYFLILFVYLSIAIITMILLNIERDQVEITIEKKEKNILQAISKKLIFSSTLLSLLTIIMSFAMFFILPRVSLGFLKDLSLDTVQVTGFSDRVDLGDIGEIKEDDTVVMRVETNINDINPFSSFYFRGSVLDYYDGTSWNKTSTEKKHLRYFIDKKLNVANDEGNTIEQTIHLEPLSTKAVFSAGKIQQIKGSFSSLLIDKYGSLNFNYEPRNKTSYTTYSITGKLKNKFPTKETLSTVYSAMPPDHERIETFTKRILKDVTGDFKKAKFIENYLKKNYKYTLKPNIKDAKHPILDFLFNTKEGFCEHYATAMALMLRTEKIPTRIVTGFLQGTWNDYGGYYVITNKDAHSWVEVYIDDIGWIVFDPTPPVPTDVKNNFMALTLFIDSLKQKWTSKIINFTYLDQMAMADNLRDSYKEFKQKDTTTSSKKIKKNAIFLYLILLLFLVTIFIIVKETRKDKHKYKKTPLFYIDMLGLLSKKGFIKEKNETAKDFKDRVKIREVNFLTDSFEKTRYGNKTLNKEEEFRCKENLDTLKITLKDLH